MARQIPQAELNAILAAIRDHPDGASLSDITNALNSKLAQRTLQYRLRFLFDQGRITKAVEGRRVKYRLPTSQPDANPFSAQAPKKAEDAIVPLSRASGKIRRYLSRPLAARKPVGYKREFLDSYRPNETFYLSKTERAHIAKIGKPSFAVEGAGTYAKQILNRLLIDLSWNSSRLEGNTYSLLDTKRLIEFGQEAERGDRREAQMIINHKEAISFLVSSADEIDFNRYTILNLHAILAQNLLDDPAAAGRLRHIPIGIEKSTFEPLAVPQLIDECFNQMVTTAATIHDPFEQAFFIMVQLPYLQPFDDVNKRVSRLSANIPFIKRNLSPLSFTDVPRPTYTEAVLAVYELNKVDLLKDVFMWAYERSAQRYAAVRQSLGEPDPFRFKHSAALKEIVAEVIRGQMDRKSANAHIANWTEKHMGPDERERFREIAESEILGMHEGNFARYQIRPSEFDGWRKNWNAL
jgi:Fic family protein